MYPGRNPKPTELKKLEGNPGNRPLNENEPKPQKEMLQYPDYIKDNPIAKKDWGKDIDSVS